MLARGESLSQVKVASNLVIIDPLVLSQWRKYVARNIEFFLKSDRRLLPQVAGELKISNITSFFTRSTQNLKMYYAALSSMCISFP